MNEPQKHLQNTQWKDQTVIGLGKHHQWDSHSWIYNSCAFIY